MQVIGTVLRTGQEERRRAPGGLLNVRRPECEIFDSSKEPPAWRREGTIPLSAELTAHNLPAPASLPVSLTNHHSLSFFLSVPQVSSTSQIRQDIP